jgi:hypothetical protein
MWIKNVTAFAKRSGSTIDDIESVDRQHNLKTKVATVPHNNGITATFFANDEPAIANNQQPGGGVGVTSHAARISRAVTAKSGPQFFMPSFLSEGSGPDN